MITMGRWHSKAVDAPVYVHIQPAAPSVADRRRGAVPAALQWDNFTFGQASVAVPISFDEPVSPTSVASSSSSSSTMMEKRPLHQARTVEVFHVAEPLTPPAGPPPRLHTDLSKLEAREILQEARDALQELFGDKMLLQSFPALKMTLARQDRLDAQLDEYERYRGQFCLPVHKMLHTRTKFADRVRQHGEHVQTLMERLLGRKFSTLTDPRSHYSPLQLEALEDELGY